MATPPAVTPDFGTAGKITKRVDNAAVPLHVSNGDYLSFCLSTNAPAPAFNFSCLHRKWKSSADYPTAQATYKWSHFANNGDEDGPNDWLGVTMFFFGAPATYTLKVARCDKAGNSISTVKDLDFTSNNASDFTTSSFQVLTV